MKNILLPVGLVALVLGGLIIYAAVKDGNEAPANEETLSVVATFYPLAFAAEEIGGGAVEVTNLTSGGLEPHDFEPTAGDIIAMQEADVLLALGDLDVWAQPAIDLRRQANLPTVVVEDTVVFKEHDPHIWLDPVLMKTLVLDVQEALTAAAPEQAGEFQQNAIKLLADLDLLDDDYLALEQCQRDDMIVAHDAFGYLADRYGFVTHAVSGISPDQEPSARDLAALAETAEELDIQTIFFESTASPALANTLAREIEAETGVLATLESLSSEEQAAHEDYFTLMRQNLQAIRAELCR